MSCVTRLKQQKRLIIKRHARPENLKGLIQVSNTLIPLAALWYAAAWSAGISYWLTAGVTLLMSLFLLRVFVLMHDCGHGCLFRSTSLNRTFGFLFGVLSGMPQYVWSKHHAYHHATNGNWARYRGPLAIVTAEEFGAMNERQRRRYRRARTAWLAPIAGFFYVLFNPRINWIKGSIQLLVHVAKGKVARPEVSLKSHVAEFKTPYWNTAQEYRHMLWNNLVLLGGWVMMCLAVGPTLFFPVYIVSVSLAGGGGILLFTVQHNFEHSYASGDEDWDHDAAAVHGTSFLVLPRWLNWFTSNIGYHHVHHLSAAIPNYRLARCHREHQELFTDVIRLRFSQVFQSLTYILWDTGERRIISIEEYEQRGVEPVSESQADAA